jgi:hypothetical protein
MRDSEELASRLVLALVSRIVANPAPSWPLPIFEAEADLYPCFLHDLIDAFDAMRNVGGTDHDIASCLQSPSRIVELCYFLLGASRSGLKIEARRSLAVTLATALACTRPVDPLCRHGANLILGGTEAVDLGTLQVSVPQPGRALAQLRAALLSLAELLHVGIPQYGREIHGPYQLNPSSFMIVRDYFDFQMPEVWPPTADFPVNRIRLVEVYGGTPEVVRFDISNHMTAQTRFQDLVASYTVQVQAGAGPWSTADADTLTGTVLALHDEVLSSAVRYSQSDWRRQHHRARYHYLTPMLRFARRAASSPPLRASVTGPADVEHWYGMLEARLYTRLCADLGLAPRSANG